MSLRRRGNASLSSSICSVSSTRSLHLDEDAITPCPDSEKPQASIHECECSQEEHSESRPMPSRSTSWRQDDEGHFNPAPSNAGDVDDALLWKRMLAIQRIFGCYRSARMSAALENGVQDGGVPSKTCLDLLNDSIDSLPEDSRRQLDQFLQFGRVKRRSSKGLWWKEKLHLGRSGPSSANFKA